MPTIVAAVNLERRGSTVTAHLIGREGPLASVELTRAKSASNRKLAERALASGDFCAAWDMRYSWEYVR